MSQVPLRKLQWPDVATVFEIDATATSSDKAVPIHLIAKPVADTLEQLDFTDEQRCWLRSTGFDGTASQLAMVPSRDGTLSAVLLGLGEADEADPCGPVEFLAGSVARALPKGTYTFANLTAEQEASAALAFGLGAYQFIGYANSDKPKQDKVETEGSKTDANDNGAAGKPRLRISSTSAPAVSAKTEGVWLARDMINTPASDLGPEEISGAARLLAEQHGADFSEVVGDDLLTQNFPMIHAVGRASPRLPRLVEVRWKPEVPASGLPKVTLVGKGICFDTGGLDLKPAAAMLLMKKDMGGSATAVALAHMIMAAKLPVELRLLIATAENSVAGNAFRPGDVLMSRLGKTVEIGNTDAEGRLVLADALALADEEAPDYLMSFATLTGAARVALGPDLPAFFCSSDAFAQRVQTAGQSVADPVWRMPLWKNYDRRLKSPVADMNNISDGPFAGAITAALFLKRFVSQAQSFAHFDLYGWRPSPSPLGPKGGEPGSARAVFEALSEELSVS
ncbi:MAG: leucyl aminopeptidase family protein [Pseudomonadota bacterium]